MTERQNNNNKEGRAAWRCPLRACGHIAIWMDLEIIILSEISQTELNKYLMISLVCEISNVIQMDPSTIQKWTHRHREHSCGCRGGWGGRIVSFGLADVNYHI